MVYEVETNRLIPLYTPLFFGWTISLSKLYFLRFIIHCYAAAQKCHIKQRKAVAFLEVTHGLYLYCI